MTESRRSCTCPGVSCRICLTMAPQQLIIPFPRVSKPACPRTHVFPDIRWEALSARGRHIYYVWNTDIDTDFRNEHPGTPGIPVAAPLLSQGVNNCSSNPLIVNSSDSSSQTPTPTGTRLTSMQSHPCHNSVCTNCIVYKYRFIFFFTIALFYILNVETLATSAIKDNLSATPTLQHYPTVYSRRIPTRELCNFGAHSCHIYQCEHLDIVM